MSAELLFALTELQKDKGIDKEVIIKAIEEALNATYSNNGEYSENTSVEFDRETGKISVYARKTVVETVTDDTCQLSLEEAQKMDPNAELDDIAEFEVTPKNFGRLAAQKAKQIIVQKIREEERNMIFDQYISKEKDIVNGTVQRVDIKNKNEKIVYVDLGKIEAIMLPSEQVPGEQYKPHDRIKTYVVEVKKTNKDPRIMISRTHPGLIKRLFELEVPEIQDGTVEIKSISREPGSRTKIAVMSHDDKVEPVGACVGQKGTRIQIIVDELNGERIDVIKWSSDIAEYISSSLSPARPIQVTVSEQEKSAEVIVPDHQLSLAIGKEGQNVRLAAKLTGWKIDIKSESQIRSTVEEDLFYSAEETALSQDAVNEDESIEECETDVQ